MQLQVGKCYVTRDGQTVGPLEYKQEFLGDIFPFSAGLGEELEFWKEDGTFGITSVKGPLDLVAEAVSSDSECVINWRRVNFAETCSENPGYVRLFFADGDHIDWEGTLDQAACNFK